MGVHILDRYYLSSTLLITVAYQLIFFAIAFTLKFDKLTDFAGGTNFVLLAALTLGFSSAASPDGSSPQHAPNARQIVASLFLVAWALRLSGFLLFRIVKTGTDTRFDDKRDRFFPFLGFWVFQMAWVWTVSLPVTVLNSPAVQEAYPDQRAFGTGRDVAGVVLFAVGLGMEAISDAQRYRWRSARKGEGDVCDKGFWRWTRHPNYFGEILVQFSIYMIAVSAAADGPVGGQASKALYATILGPLFLTLLLMFVSGLPLSERPGAKKRYEKGDNWEDYNKYLQRTSILIPFPPALYARMPMFLKRTLFLEFPMYVFDPTKHSDASMGQRLAEGGHGGRAGGSGDNLVRDSQQGR